MLWLLRLKEIHILEITWTVIPILLALFMFYLGWAGWKPTTKATERCHEHHRCCKNVEFYVHL